MLTDYEEHSFRKRLIAGVKEQIDIITQPVLSGSCLSFEDYKHKTGRLQSLSDVLAMADRIIEEMTGLDPSEM